MIMGETQYHRQAVIEASDLGLRAGHWPDSVTWSHRQWVRAYPPKRDDQGYIQSVRYVSKMGKLEYIEVVND